MNGANQEHDRRTRDPRIERIVVEHEELKQRVENNEKAISFLVKSSVAEGIKEAVADPKTWDAFFAALGRRAQNEAGNVAMAGIKKLLTHAFWWAIAGAIVYAFGGWGLLMTYLRK